MSNRVRQYLATALVFIMTLVVMGGIAWGFGELAEFMADAEAARCVGLDYCSTN